MKLDDFGPFDVRRTAPHDVADVTVSRTPCRTGGAVAGIGDNGDRTIRYIFSDQSVARDGHTIRTNGWDLSNFLTNPVFLWCHDSSEPPVGRVVDIAPVGQQLLGTVEYAEEGLYPFADMIFRMVKGNFLNATSVSWLPLKWKYSADKGRPGGIDFIEQELLEISQVPVPALPTAIATARASGIDTKPLYDWAEKVLDTGDKIIISRAELETLRREAQMPKPKPAPQADNEHKATVTFLFEHAGSRYLLNGRAQLTDEEVDSFGSSMRAGKIEAPQGFTVETLPAVTRAETPKLTKRGLTQVSYLAGLLAQLGYLSESVDYEAEWEGDGSEVPGQLVDAMKALGQVLVNMTVEEVGEMFAGSDDDDQDERAAAVALLRKLDDGAVMGIRAAMESHLAGNIILITDKGKQTELERAGKTLSADTCRALEDAHDKIEEARGMVRGVIDKSKKKTSDDSEDDDDASSDEAERALRLRKAKALKLKIATGEN